MMSTHFDEAFIVQENPQSIFVDDDYNDDRLFDFTAASNDVELFDNPSDDDDGLYGESVLDAARPADEEDLGDEEDASVTGDGDFSWRIEHATGDHKLKGRVRIPCGAKWHNETNIDQLKISSPKSNLRASMAYKPWKCSTAYTL